MGDTPQEDVIQALHQLSQLKTYSPVGFTGVFLEDITFMDTSYNVLGMQLDCEATFRNGPVTEEKIFLSMNPAQLTSMIAGLVQLNELLIEGEHVSPTEITDDRYNVVMIGVEDL